MQRCLERQPNIYFNKNLAISKIGHFIRHVYSDKESDTFTCFQEWSILGWKVTSGQLLYTPLQTACDNQYLTRQFVLSPTLPCNVYINNNFSNNNQLLQKNMQWYKPQSQPTYHISSVNECFILHTWKQEQDGARNKELIGRIK